MFSEDVAIRVSGLGKCYQIYEKPSDRLRQFILPRVQRIFRRPEHSYGREFWAQRDVSFEVRRGESVGIIGRNGSGKSTLLQIICGTLSPTCGSVEVQGRVAALLELGAGFNPEFSGRENVFMNAALLGLTAQQTQERFDRIAAFADIGAFMDQPVKTYSSGMFVRLAFAVIAHVDADILVIDEALAVGDALFTQKCMRFIRNFQSHGTLLFVSHDTSAVQNLCRRALWLSGGELRQDSTASEVTEAYLRYTLQESYGSGVELTETRSSAGGVAASADAAFEEAKIKDSGGMGENEVSSTASASLLDYGARFDFTDNIPSATGWKTGAAEMVSLSIERVDGRDEGVFGGGEKVRVRIRAQANVDLTSPILGFILRDRLGQDLFGENTLPFTALQPCPVRRGELFEGVFVFQLPMLPNGQYALMASVAEGHQYENTQHHYMHDAVIVNVTSSRVRFGLAGVPIERVSLARVSAAIAVEE